MHPKVALHRLASQSSPIVPLYFVGAGLKPTPTQIRFRISGLFGIGACCCWLLMACSTSRPDLVWMEDGRQYGKASWYDDHGKRTASGEIYNMNAMTAAHPSLALNTIVEVTNLRNGRRVKLRVNDRLPPIHDGRVIDLSKIAFRHLASLDQGLLDVEIRVIRYGNNKYVETNRSAPRGKMYLSGSKQAANNSRPSRSSLKG